MTTRISSDEMFESCCWREDRGHLFHITLVEGQVTVWNSDWTRISKATVQSILSTGSRSAADLVKGLRGTLSETDYLAVLRG